MVTTFSPHRISAGIRHAEIEGARVILDLNTTSYRILDHIGSAMWSVLLGERTQVDVLTELTRIYDAPLPVLERDLERFGHRCVKEHLLLSPLDVPRLITPEPKSDAPRRAFGWHWLEALRSLVVTNRRIAREGLRPVYERYASLPVGAPRLTFPKAVAAFRAAENMYVSSRAPDDCLARSLSLYRYLRSAGFPVEHVIAVRRIPFRAHAWVECEREIILDRPLDGYVPLARLGA